MDNDVNRPGRLTFKTFLQIYIRSLFVQGSFSAKYRQCTGFAFCMEPVGKALRNDRESQRAFLLRHTEFYNGNPMMITLVLGAVARMEEMLRYHEGIREDDIALFKKAAGSLTGSIGDSFFWNTLRPFGIILGLFVTFFYGLWGILVLLAVFNIPVLVLRWRWLKTGYNMGKDVVSEIRNQTFEKTITTLKTISIVLLSFLTVVYVAAPHSALNWYSGATAGLFALCVFLLRRAVRFPLVLLFFTGFAFIIGILLNTFIH